MTKNTTYCILILFIMLFNSFSYSETHPQYHIITERLLDKKGVDFANLEHQYFGNEAILRFSPDDVGTKGTKLNLPNGMKLSYGDLMMFAGDMFGDTNYPISHCPLQNMSQCFYKQFDALAVTGAKEDTNCKNPYNQVSNLKNYLNDIEKRLNKARKKGEKDWEFYSKIASEITKSLNRLTCGGSKLSVLFPFGSYISLAEHNFDHFAPDAISAYKVGHNEALIDAIKAHKLVFDDNDANKGQTMLELAYAKNAFSSHFLSDSLSSGHLRTPRFAIHDSIKLPAILKLLIANFMHDEDNRHGLEVVNAKGLAWRAYGDGYFFKSDAYLHRYVMTKVIQSSIDGVFNAFITGEKPNDYAELAYLPILQKIESLNDSAPLFKIKQGKLLKRININDTHNHRYTSNWSGLLTLLELELLYDKS
jgi:hypothetical protein